tara:strand:- start:511 stop:678 length:168 start_codon:yes stop_codon:yes gene_type:complete
MTNNLFNISQCSPRLVSQQPYRPEDEEEFTRMSSMVFKENQSTPTDDAIQIMMEM